MVKNRKKEAFRIGSECQIAAVIFADLQNGSQWSLMVSQFVGVIGILLSSDSQTCMPIFTWIGYILADS